MSTVRFDKVSKSFGVTEVLTNVSLSIGEGEFVSFLGPSGCGKTTLLRILAGLEKNTKGQVFIDSDLVSDPENFNFVSPEKRKVGMVFQSYAVWPHMTVFENVAFPLRIAKISNNEIQKMVKDILDLVELSGLEERMPHQLSGGQQQRVALARGLVARPRVLLLDEPLSNLDAQLREKMRLDIRSIQKLFKMTVVLVTHDQIEAFEMSDKIFLINKGQIVQAGTPSELKNNPINEFAAQFFGLKFNTRSL